MYCFNNLPFSLPQKINSAGDVEWEYDGNIVCDDPSAQDEAVICSDGNNGAIIAWRETRYSNNDIFGRLEVVFDRLQSSLVAIEPDVPYLCVGYQAPDWFHHPQAGAQDRDECDSLDKHMPRRLCLR